MSWTKRRRTARELAEAGARVSGVRYMVGKGGSIVMKVGHDLDAAMQADAPDPTGALMREQAQRAARNQ